MSGPEDEPRRGEESEVIELASRRRRPDPAPGTGDSADDAEPDRRASTIALIVALVIVVVGYLLIKELSDTSKVNDCIMSGRKNCVPLDLPAHRSALPFATG